MVVKNFVVSIGVFLVLTLLLMAYPTSAQEDIICTVYITGVGCPNCAYTDPVLLSDYTSQYDNLVVIEYEIYHNSEFNQKTANMYFDNYITNTGPGVPFLIFSKNQTALGRIEVIDSNSFIDKISSNECPLPDGSSISFENMDFAGIDGKVNI